MAKEDKQVVVFGVKGLVGRCHLESKNAGWWPFSAGDVTFLIPTKLMLIVSEISEAMEAFRKSKMDDKIPERLGIEVELADAIIRICDLAGYLGLDLEGAIEDKMAYNRVRQDHKPEARLGKHGKAF